MLLNKPSGKTSNHSLQIIKHFFGAAKAGHTGTLDPMATGLLPICFGEATKFSAYLLNADKSYFATLKLGYISSTGDAEGEITHVAQPGTSINKLSMPRVNDVFRTFIGRIRQTPPIYSALKFNGKPLYHYARQGLEIERKAREIVVYDLCLESWVGDEMSIVVRCGTGTYIRTLAEDIGKALGFGGAYLTNLCRHQIGSFSLHQAHGLDQFEGTLSEQHKAYLYPIDSILQSLPLITLDESESSSISKGQSIKKEHKLNLTPRTKVRLYDSCSSFLGVGEITEAGTLAPKRLVSQNYN